jgi:membrane-associated phospholipid phosphatase
MPFWIAGLILILATSKRQLFLEINSLNSPFFDHFFKWETWLGNGVVFVVLILILFYKNKGWGLLSLIIFSLSAILPQVLKKLVFPNEVRPVKFFEGLADLHLVDGVSNHLQHSFPSGHACSIVALCLLLSFVINENRWSYLLAMIALITMYSRVYLAQHFLLDVIAGALLGIISAWIGIAIYNKWMRDQPRLKTGLLKRKPVT